MCASGASEVKNKQEDRKDERMESCDDAAESLGSCCLPSVHCPGGPLLNPAHSLFCLSLFEFRCHVITDTLPVQLLRLLQGSSFPTLHFVWEMSTSVYVQYTKRKCLLSRVCCSGTFCNWETTFA